MKPKHIDTLQWSQALAIARQSCARVFRDGGVPADALKAFGLKSDAVPAADWNRAVEAIAEVLCARREPTAA